ncbi:uncharacterized protein LOC105184297 [Harpegnathos saltator]|uniref:uncharacterized protein LOC105184297 n=1 Tax=Harpegnathos saltator TaxID=610380 RepID=UPI000DBEE7DB|nr:uncharacterized protein LOC105184297 [Harpegnathos saltator]
MIQRRQIVIIISSIKTFVIFASQEHKQLHQSQHMQICMVVKELLNMDAELDTRRLSKEKWIQSRMELMRLIMGKLSRNLEFHEMDMIMYAKSCCICHQQTNLQTCTSSYSSSYCNDHAEKFQTVHSSNYYSESLHLLLKTALINNISDLLKFTLLFDTYEPLIDMHAFVEKHLKTGPYKELSDTVVAFNYLYSEFASGPLTLYHGLRDTKLFDFLDIECCYYVIHIIGADYYGKKYIPPWELFLHLLNHVQHLTIVLTEMNFGIAHFNIDVCSHCREHNRIISIEYYSMSFCERKRERKREREREREDNFK